MSGRVVLEKEDMREEVAVKLSGDQEDKASSGGGAKEAITRGDVE